MPWDNEGPVEAKITINSEITVADTPFDSFIIVTPIDDATMELPQVLLDGTSVSQTADPDATFD